MNSIKTIVAGVDFSQASAHALRYAARLSKDRNARLQAVHVVDTLVGIPLTDEISAFQAQVALSLIDESKQLWSQFCKDIPGLAGAGFHTEINSPVLGITRYCKDVRADLLVMGAHGVAKARGVGAVASSCVRRSPCDVLLVTEDAPERFKTILAAVDFSGTSREAVDQAVQLAAIEGAKVHVVYVFTPPWKRVKPKAGSPEATEAFRTSYAKALTDRLASFCEPSRPEVTWAKPTFHAIPHDSHGVGICEFAKTLNADLVVLGTRGASNIHDILLGSTAERVVRDAGRSILAVRPMKAAKE